MPFVSVLIYQPKKKLNVESELHNELSLKFLAQFTRSSLSDVLNIRNFTKNVWANWHSGLPRIYLFLKANNSLVIKAKLLKIGNFCLVTSSFDCLIPSVSKPVCY